MTDLEAAVEDAKAESGWCFDARAKRIAVALLATVERAEKAEAGWASENKFVVSLRNDVGAARFERDRARAEIEKWKLKEMFFDRNLEMTKLRALLEKAEGALRFYASKEAWFGFQENGGHCRKCIHIDDLDRDESGYVGGRIARAAIKAIEAAK
jgi:hypothetical protein